MVVPRNRPGPRHSASERPAARSLLVRLQPWAGDVAQPFAIRRQDFQSSFAIYSDDGGRTWQRGREG